MDLINYEFPIVNVSCLDEATPYKKIGTRVSLKPASANRMFAGTKRKINDYRDLLKNKRIKFTDYESLIMDELVEEFKNLSIDGKKYLEDKADMEVDYNN